MGLQRQAQYRLMLNMQKSGLRQVRGGTFAVSFIDHMLCIYTYTNGVVLSMSREDAIRTIANRFANHYNGLSIDTEYLVLAADGGKSPKPAVRSQRDKQAFSDVVKFTLANVKEINSEMMAMLTEDYGSAPATELDGKVIKKRKNSVGCVPITDDDSNSSSASTEHMFETVTISDDVPRSGSFYVPPHKRKQMAAEQTPVLSPRRTKTPKIILITGPPDWNQLGSCEILAKNFDGDHPFTPDVLQNCYCESDVYMFTQANRLSKKGLKCAIISKDSDVLGTLLCMGPGPDITVFFQTNQYSFVKDFDNYFKHRIESMIPIRDGFSENFDVCLKKFNGDVNLMMLDVLDISPFPGLLTTANGFRRKLAEGGLTDTEIKNIYKTLYALGVRGALFRRLAARMTTVPTQNEIKLLTKLTEHTITSVKQINKDHAKSIFYDATCGFTVDISTSWNKSLVDQDGFSVVTHPNFKELHDVIIKPHNEADMKKDFKLNGQRLHLMKAYAAGIIMPDTYGQYMLFNLGNASNMVGVSITPGIPAIRSQGAGVMCLVSGTDYNLTIPKIGMNGILKAWMNKNWESFAEMIINRIFKNPDGSSVLKTYMEMAGATPKIKAVDHTIVDMAEKTTEYVLDLWSGQPLKSFEYYGYRRTSSGLEYNLTGDVELDEPDNE